MSFTYSNWTCLSASLNQGQKSVIPFGSSSTILNSPNLFMYGSPNDTISEITSVGYFNPVITELSVNDWIIGNGTDGSFLLYVSDISNGTVSVLFIIDENGPYLLTANNLSDVQNRETSLSNLGFGNGQLLNLTDSDFSGGIYTLTNPCPSFVNVACNNPGNELRLPPAQGTKSFSLGFGPTISGVDSTVSFALKLNSGADFSIFAPNSGSIVLLKDKSTSDGTWQEIPEVSSINNTVTGNAVLESKDGSITITSSLVDNTIDFAVNGSVSVTLQDAYNNGNGTITIENADNTKPFSVGRNETNLLLGYGVYVSATRNLQVSPTKPWFHFFEALDNSSTNTQFGAISCDVLDGTPGAVAGLLEIGAAIPGDQQVVPFIALNGSQSLIELLYDVQNFNATATTGNTIRNYSFSAPNASASVVNYVNLQSFLSDNTAGAEDGLLNIQVQQAGVLTTYIQLLGGSSTIGIDKPTIYSGVLNINGQNIVNVANLTTASSPDPSAQLQLTSTTKAFLPNVMSTSQFSSISSKATGLMAYDSNKLRYTSWNGSAVKDIAYTSDIGGQSGTYVPTFSGASGGNTFTLIKALYSASSTTSGSVVNVTLQFTYTATNGSGSVSISLPIGTTFTSTGQAALSGGEVYASTPAIGDGLLINVDTIATQSTITATWIVAVSSGSKTVNLSFAYQIH